MIFLLLQFLRITRAYNPRDSHCGGLEVLLLTLRRMLVLSRKFECTNWISLSAASKTALLDTPSLVEASVFEFWLSSVRWECLGGVCVAGALI